MSSNTQFKEYNKRLKAQVKSLTEANKELSRSIHFANLDVDYLSIELKKCKKSKTNWFRKLFNKN